MKTIGEQQLQKSWDAVFNQNGCEERQLHTIQLDFNSSTESKIFALANTTLPQWKYSEPG